MKKKATKSRKIPETRTKEQRYRLKGFFYYFTTALIAVSVILACIFASGVDLTAPALTARFIVAVLALVVAAVYVFNVVRFLTLLLLCGEYKKYVMSTMSDYVRMKQGCSGTGKSSSGTHEAVYMAQALKVALLTEYWSLSRMQYRSERQEKDYLEVKKAYDYYTAEDARLNAEARARIDARLAELKRLLQEVKRLPRGRAKRALQTEYRSKRKIYLRQNSQEIRGCIWCLWSNIPIRVGNRMSIRATADYLVQLKPLPVFSVLFWDEVGNTLAKMGFTQTQITQFIEEVFRYPRHYGEFRIIMTEQEGNNVLNVTRKNIAFMDLFTRHQEKLMTPLLFSLLHRLIDWYLSKRKYNARSWALAGFYRWVKDLEKNIGFRKFFPLQIGNQEQAGAGKVLSKVRPRYAYATLNCEYDDRTYRDGYKAKDKQLEGKAWEKLDLTVEEIDEERELRENLLSKPSVELRKELGLKLTNFELLSDALVGLDVDIDRVNVWVKKLFNKKKPIPINKLTEQQFTQLLGYVAKYRARHEQIQDVAVGLDDVMGRVQTWLKARLKTTKEVDLMDVTDEVLKQLLRAIQKQAST